MKPEATILDACCGSRMFWFDRDDERCLFLDKRSERHELADASSAGGKRILVIEPDIVADFTALPFDDARFSLVIFDPPHLIWNGSRGWLAKKYGKLGEDWPAVKGGEPRHPLYVRGDAPLTLWTGAA